MPSRVGERALPSPPEADAAAHPAVQELAESARCETSARAALSGCILAVARRSDHTAFAVLFSHFAPRLKTYFLRGGTTEAVAEELAQETMVLVWRKADRFDPRKAAASTWIFAIGRNVRTDALRRDRHAPASLSEASGEALCSPKLDAAPDAEDLAASAQREEHLRHALLALPREQMEVLRLSYFGDRSHTEIGGTLGVPLGTVKGRLRQALTRLRAALNGGKP